MPLYDESVFRVRSSAVGMPASSRFDRWRRRTSSWAAEGRSASASCCEQTDRLDHNVQLRAPQSSTAARSCAAPLRGPYCTLLKTVAKSLLRGAYAAFASPSDAIGCADARLAPHARARAAKCAALHARIAPATRVHERRAVARTTSPPRAQRALHSRHPSADKKQS